MSVRIFSDDRIAETSSKGNQEKWFDKESGLWYKLDQFGYEALSEALISKLLEKSEIERKTPFTFVRYEVQKAIVHGKERVCCVSENFLKSGEEIITLNKLLSNEIGRPLKLVLNELSSDRKRLSYIGNMTSEITGLDFGRYLAVLFEIDSVFLNTDRHLNNIAVLYKDGAYDYCPIFDNGAGLLSNIITMRTDIDPQVFVKSAVSFPFGMTFTRQLSEVRRAFGGDYVLPVFSESEIRRELEPLVQFYPERDRHIISERVLTVITQMQVKITYHFKTAF